MKKAVQMLCILAGLILLGFVVFAVQSRTVQFQINNQKELVLSVKADNGEEVITPWFDEEAGIYYFFLPSFVKNNCVYCDNVQGNITIDEKKPSWLRGFLWEEEQVYTVAFGENTYSLKFMKSANIPSLFLETDSGSMEYLHADKANVEEGSLSLIKESGNVEYQGSLKRVSARGNSTFSVEKKSYTVTLNAAAPLCGLEAGKKWNLLALSFEDNKIQSKLIFDMAKFLDMEYASECAWVDLYCNGEYQGLYLLTEAVTVADGRVEIYDLEKENEAGIATENISGGYLIERDEAERLDGTESYFTTDICNYLFVVKSPDVPTDTQLSYIKDYVQNVENLLTLEDSAYEEYVDFDSFAKQFLLDKLVLNPDAMRMSAFYYKDRNSNLLKAGPLWDYDRAMGVSLPNYKLSIGDYPDSMNGWYMPLYNNEDFKNVMMESYEKLLPYLQELLVSGIDEYAECIEASVQMDSVMWPSKSVYKEHANYVRYLKYFLANRVAFLNELWGFEMSAYEAETLDAEHKVSFYGQDGELIESRMVKDGDCISEPPQMEEDVYEWYYNENGNEFSSRYPIYEDMEIYAKYQFATPEEYMEYQLDKIRNEESLENYLKLLKEDNLSLCIYLPENSELFLNETYLTAIKELSAYKVPAELDGAAMEGKEYFILIDNGWQDIWESTDGASLSEVATTFGALSYKKADDGRSYLYIQDDGNDYLADVSEETMAAFVVINRLTGGIEHVAVFDEQENAGTSEAADSNVQSDEAQGDADTLFAAFINGEIPAVYADSDRDAFYITDLPFNEEDYFSYTVGDRVDLDNDGEKELILQGPYGGKYLDARDGQIYVLTEGEGTAATVSYTVFDEKTWIVHSDTTHGGRIMYHFSLYDKAGAIVDEFGLNKEYWNTPDEPDGPDTVYTYRDEQIDRQEYEELLQKMLYQDGN